MRASLCSICLAGLASCATPTRVPRPAIITATAWGSDPDPIPAAKRHEITRVTIHHAGVVWKRGDDPFRKIRALQAWGKRDKGWPDVPYHFLIAPDGRIFEGRNLHYAGETNTEYDTHGHALVQLWGNFEVQPVPAAQLDAAVDLVAWICAAYEVSPSTIAGHRDVSNRTVCPGRDLYRYIADGSFRRRVELCLQAGGVP